MISGRDETTLISTAGLFQTYNPKSAFVKADMQQVESIRSMVDFANEHLGGLDVVVNIFKTLQAKCSYIPDAVKYEIESHLV